MEKNIVLKKIVDESIIQSQLEEAKSSGHEVFIWRIVGDTKYMAKVQIESFKKHRKELSIIPLTGEDKKVENLIGSHATIDLFIPESSLLFRCNVKQSEMGRRYSLDMPTTIAQADRRKYLRLKVFGKNEVKLTFLKAPSGSKSHGQHFSKDCFDISVGGFSFYISKLEYKYFSKGDQIRAVHIVTPDWSGTVEAEIAIVREIEPNSRNGLIYKAWKISCRFKAIDQISKKYLEKFIFERIKNELRAINDS